MSDLGDLAKTIGVGDYVPGWLTALINSVGYVPDAVFTDLKPFSFVPRGFKDRAVWYDSTGVDLGDAMAALQDYSSGKRLLVNIARSDWARACDVHEELRTVRYYVEPNSFFCWGRQIYPGHYPSVEGGSHWLLALFVRGNENSARAKQDFLCGVLHPVKLGTWVMFLDRTVDFDDLRCKYLVDFASLSNVALVDRECICLVDLEAYGVRPTADSYWRVWADFVCNIACGYVFRLFSVRKANGYRVNGYLGGSLVYTGTSQVRLGCELVSSYNLGGFDIVLKPGEEGVVEIDDLYSDRNISQSYDYPKPTGKYWTVESEMTRVLLTRMMLPDGPASMYASLLTRVRQVIK